MKEKSYESLKKNLIDDLSNCSRKELDLIYKMLKECLKKFDRDGIFKNCRDFFKLIFKNKKEKCLYFINDVEDSKDKLTDTEKEELRKYFLSISNVHRTFLENLQALFGAS